MPEDGVDDPFPFLFKFDGREMEQRRKNHVTAELISAFHSREPASKAHIDFNKFHHFRVEN